MRIISPLKNRRVHTNSEDNIHVEERGSSFRLRRVRLNTLQNEEEIIQRKISLHSKNPSRQLLEPMSPFKQCKDLLYQDQTKLNISSESWTAYNLKQQKYKRGWKPNKKAEFNGLLRIVVFQCFYELLAQHHCLQTVKVRINGYLLKQNHSKRQMSLKALEKKLLEQRKKPQQRSLSQNTLINFKDLIKGMMLTNSQDLLQTACIYLGFCINTFDHCKNRQLQSLLYLDSWQDGQYYLVRFVQYANSHLKMQKLIDSEISQEYQFKTTPNQLSIIVANILRGSDEFVHVLEMREFTTVIRYQVGYKFYQDRIKKFVSERPELAHRVVVNWRGVRNYGVVCYNKLTSNIIVLQDCKFSMSEIDIKRVQEWLSGMSKPIAESKCKLLPLIHLLQ